MPVYLKKSIYCRDNNALLLLRFLLESKSRKNNAPIFSFGIFSRALKEFLDFKLDFNEKFSFFIYDKKPGEKLN